MQINCCYNELTLTALLGKEVKTSAGLYVHIPFCKQACYYCNFHFSTKRKNQTAMVQSIGQELILRQNHLENRPITSIYFGGGTPSLLTLLEIEHLLTKISYCFSIASDVEITLEANPDDLSLEKLKGLYQLGINRLSIGIQSFNDKTLQYMNRAHTSAMAQNSIQWARAAQFSNLNIDLIYAIPGTTTLDWQADIAQALLLEPEHISAYCLTIEPKTVFDYQHKQQRLWAISQEIAAEQFELAIETFSQKDYLHYEIANFCKPGKFSKHNINYWKSVPYIGIGPGAHSYNNWKRLVNIENNTKYIEAIQNNCLPYTEEILTVANRINEYIMTSIRTCWGCDFNWISDQYGVDFLATQGNYITNLLTWKLAYLTNHTLYLTNKGKLLASQIASDLFILDPNT